MLKPSIERLKRYVALLIPLIALVLFVAYSVVNGLNIEYMLFSLVGMIGAVFANGTGAGGGAVFVPVFSLYDLTEDNIVATSFTIQCFGMVAGSISWLFHYLQARTLSRDWQCLFSIICLVSIPSASTVFVVYFFFGLLTQNTELMFSYFSIAMGLIIITTHLYAVTKKTPRIHINLTDKIVLVGIGLIGGAVTSVISIGVGELLAVYLILRGFSVALSIASAVIVTAITVWSGAYFHWYLNPQYVTEILQYSIPGALIGGYFAAHIVTRLSPARVKMIFACWIILSGVTILVLKG